MSLESLQQQYNLLHNLLDKLEDQCQLWIEKQNITSIYASSILNLISQQNDTKSFMKKSNNDFAIKQGKKLYTRNYISDFTSNGTNVVSYLPALEMKTTYEFCSNLPKNENNNIPTIQSISSINLREKVNSTMEFNSNLEIPEDTPAIVSFLSYFPNVIEKLLVKQQYNIEQAIKNFKEESEAFGDIRDTMVKIKTDAKNSVRAAYRRAIEYDKNPKGPKDEEEETLKEKVVNKMSSMEKAHIPLVDLQMWIDRIVTSYERECTVKEYLVKRLREGSLVEFSEWDNWNSRWNSQSYLNFEFEQEVRDKIKAYKQIRIYEKEKERDI